MPVNQLFTVMKLLKKCMATEGLTLYGQIKTAQKRTIIQQYGDWYTGPFMGRLFYLVQRAERPGQAVAPPIPLHAVSNVTAHPSTASVPTSYYLMWHYGCLWTQWTLLSQYNIVRVEKLSVTGIRHINQYKTYTQPHMHARYVQLHLLTCCVSPQTQEVTAAKRKRRCDTNPEHILKSRRRSKLSHPSRDMQRHDLQQK